MDYSHEIIKYEKGDLIKVGFQTNDFYYPHWHHSMELIMVLTGNGTINTEKRKFPVREGDIILINADEIHDNRVENGLLAVFQIPAYAMEHAGISPNTRFQCNSVITSQGSVVELRKILIKILVAAINNTDGNKLIISSLFYQLMYELTMSFQHSVDNKPLHKKEHLDRLDQVMDYINTNYNDEITLADAASRALLTPTYFSMLFKRNIGMNFFQYLTSIRLHHAASDLLEKKATIEEIALDNGFANSKYFVKVFKKQYQMSPSHYRSLYRTENDKPESEVPKIETFSLLNNDLLTKAMTKYLDQDSESKQKIVCSFSEISLSALSKPKKLVKSWKKLLNVGKAKEILMHDVQEQIKMTQQQIGFQYIKFHGMLDDSMMLYNEKTDGSFYLSYYYVDEVIDFLISVGLRPMIEFSFMPRLLAENPNHVIFQTPSIISKPKDNERWREVILSLMRHFISRYGFDSVKNWIFTFWCDPFQDMYMNIGKLEDFCRLYEITYRCVKKFGNEIKFASSSYLAFCSVPGKDFTDYLDYCSVHDCFPDLYLFDFYSLENSSPEENSWISHIGMAAKQPLKLTPNENSLGDFLCGLKHVLDPYEKKPICLGEWNFTCSQREWLNDTCYGSVSLIKNILENNDKIKYFGRWCLTDLFEETQDEEELFYGNIGMIAKNSVKKPAYYAYCLLNGLGEEVLDKGDGYFFTRNRGANYALMLYNYQHYSPLYGSGIKTEADFVNRYGAFSPLKKLSVSLKISSLEKGKYMLTTTVLNREHGSSFDQWVKMGAKPLETNGELTTLKNLSAPRLLKNTAVIENELSLDIEMEPLEVRLIELKKIN